ncbi:hypothetical protein [Streptomyces sp. NPDC005533]|uniref:hypothetical protein n=1 Tax=Streptomyces sp. NPDC005533 TaxID=3364723 RepID=UPI0036C70EC6
MAHHSQPPPAEVRGPVPPSGSGTRLRDRGRRILAATAAVALLLTGVTACGGGTAEGPASTGGPAAKEPFAPAQLAQAWKKVDTLTIPRFAGSDTDTVYVLGGKATKDMAGYAYAAKDGARTRISTVKAPDTALSMGGVAVDYRADSLEPGRYAYGAVMFRAATP